MRMLHRSLVLLLVLGVFVAPVGAQSAATSRGSDQERLVRAFFEEQWNQGSGAGLEERISDDFRFHFRGRAMEMDAAGLMEMVGSWRNAFAGLRLNVEDVVVDGDKAAARLTFTGTHAAETWDIEPTGRTVNVTMMAFFRFEGGRIAEIWEDYDEQGLRQQLLRTD